MVIPMIAIIERGMRIPIDRVTRDYIITRRLSLTQCAPNMFRILGSVDALNERMNVNFTYHNVNWVYNRHKLMGQGYYLKTRVSMVRLISYLSKSNKAMDKDFLIISGEWHDGLHCLTREGTPCGLFRSRSSILTLSLFLLTPSILISIIFTCKLAFVLLVLFSNSVFTFDEFADKYFAIPNFNLVNELDLTIILKSEIFMHTDGQLRATHIILGYDPISSSFQAPKYVTKVRDPYLHQINIAVPGFLVNPTPKGVQQVELPL